ncbi:MAG TPA: outer membrane lipoprotein-sorting protein, partial [Hyphomonas sp.]|nr:outer membrane lipoprotein-sorting protein [Hyphomonas sp.]
MLKKGGELWMFLPHVEKVQKISGHMLRQGLMGSDFSYEDMLETAALSGRYDAKVLGEEVKDGRKTWKLEMTAKSADVSYPKRVSWIDQEYGVPVREE